jgi:hypothetical protein
LDTRPPSRHRSSFALDSGSRLRAPVHTCLPLFLLVCLTWPSTLVDKKAIRLVRGRVSPVGCLFLFLPVLLKRFASPFFSWYTFHLRLSLLSGFSYLCLVLIPIFLQIFRLFVFCSTRRCRLFQLTFCPLWVGTRILAVSRTGTDSISQSDFEFYYEAKTKWVVESDTPTHHRRLPIL